MSTINTELTRWGTALNSYSRMAVRAGVSVGAGVAASCAAVPDMFLDAIPDRMLTRSSAVPDFLNFAISLNSFLPIQESFICISTLLSVKFGCYAWSMFRTIVKTADDINPLG